MGTVTYNSGKLEYRIDLSQYDLYPGQLTGDSSLDAFLRRLDESIHFFNGVDAYSSQAFKPYIDKADRILLRHAKMMYDEFLRQVKADDLDGIAFRELPFGLKKRLFDHRAKYYLNALDSCEQDGFDVIYIMSKIGHLRIFPLKDEKEEPTYQILLKYFS